MSRSVHTRPRRILAAERMRAPYAPRRDNDRTTYCRLAGRLKEAGIVLDALSADGSGVADLPRISVARANGGFVHPAGKKDIVSVLRFFGERCFYGLREIRLVQPDACSRKSLKFGALRVPGTIILYAQPVPPWFIAGDLDESSLQVLTRADAVVEAGSKRWHTVVHWSESDLRDFMLFDVLMHEVGHHMLQQYKGKRAMRMARTGDHERFAELFAACCRQEFLQVGGDCDA